MQTMAVDERYHAMMKATADMKNTVLPSTWIITLSLEHIICESRLSRTSQC